MIETEITRGPAMKQRVRTFLIGFFGTITIIACVVFYANSYSGSHTGGGMTFFDPTDPEGVWPIFLPEEVVDGVVTETGGVSRCEPQADKMVITIKGSIDAGWIEVKTVNENGRVLLERRFEPGIEYDETIVIYNAGYEQHDTVSYSVETMSTKKGLAINFECYHKRYRDWFEEEE